ncbi:MAG: glycosyltransferase family 4 protein, partial [Armatimonadetes bacterium]|nr:glycosyltransferase family 4 protein [Armatimonadota bacterium]
CTAYLSTYPPRECGIATFCEDLVGSTVLSEGVGKPVVYAMENAPEARAYTWPVRGVLHESNDEQYAEVAESINDSLVACVSIQHEFGIFGGLHGRGLFQFLDRLRKPVVTTLHTVLPEPEPAMCENLGQLAKRSQRLVVMNAYALGILHHDYGIDSEKVALIHHGVLPPSLEVRSVAKERLDLTGRKVLSTFGLVARGKGLQYVIEALPDIVKRHPEVCYLIVGQTHPEVQRAEKESYREELLNLVSDLHLQEHVRFVNRYVSKAEIVRFLAATDIYVTPYLNPHQITSGTLAYALAAGTAVVSTPYLYARFLLGDQRGRLVDFHSSASIADTVNHTLEHTDEMKALQRRARLYGQQMYWPAVGARYLKLFHQVVREYGPLAAPVRPQLELGLSTAISKRRMHDQDAPGSRPAALSESFAAAD